MCDVSLHCHPFAEVQDDGGNLEPNLIRLDFNSSSNERNLLIIWD